MGWNEVISNGNEENSKKVEFISLKEGITFVTPLSDVPHSRWSHWVPQAKRSVTCIGKECPICALIKEAKANNEKPKYNSRKVHSIPVIERSTKEVKILEQGNGFFEDLYDLKEEEGEITTFDLKIKRKGKGLDTSYRLDAVKHEFTEEEIEKAKENMMNLEEYFSKPTKEQILALINGEDPNEVFKKIATTSEEDIKDEDLPFEIN